MGSCHCTDLERVDDTARIREAINANECLVRALIYACIQHEKKGSAIKFMNIQRLMVDHYDKLNSQRKVVEEAQDQLTDAENQAFLQILRKELSQLKHSSKILKKAYKELTHSTFRPTTDTVITYLEHCRRVPAIDDTYQQIFNLYCKSIRLPEHAVRLLTNGQGLTETEANLILQVCQGTTYLYNDKEQKIVYELPRRLRRSESSRKSSTSSSTNM